MAMDLNYKNNHWSNAKNYHYAMTHNWDLIIDILPEALMNNQDGIGANHLFLGKDGNVNARCSSINGLPNSNLGEGILSTHIRGIPFHQPGGRDSSIQEITLRLQEFWDYRLFRLFEAWKSVAVNRFDRSQNLSAMIPKGVRIVWSDTDRHTPKLIYELYDVVCTKCSLGGEYTGDPELASVSVGLKCGYYDIIQVDGDDIGTPVYGLATAVTSRPGSPGGEG
jgi:hypothetical protein